MPDIEVVSKAKVAGGTLTKIAFESTALQSRTKVHVFLPPAAIRDGSKAAPEYVEKTLVWLSGLTCNEDNFAQKAGAFRCAAALNLAIVMPDTSPRILFSICCKNRRSNDIKRQVASKYQTKPMPGTLVKGLAFT